MMTKTKLSEIRAEVVALLEKLPGKSADAWLRKEIEAAKRDPNRDAATLEMLCAALDRQVKKRAQRKPRRRAAKR